MEGILSAANARLRVSCWLTSWSVFRHSKETSSRFQEQTTLDRAVATKGVVVAAGVPEAIEQLCSKLVVLKDVETHSVSYHIAEQETLVN